MIEQQKGVGLFLRRTSGLNGTYLVPQILSTYQTVLVTRAGRQPLGHDDIDLLQQLDLPNEALESLGIVFLCHFPG